MANTDELRRRLEAIIYKRLVENGPQLATVRSLSFGSGDDDNEVGLDLYGRGDGGVTHHVLHAGGAALAEGDTVLAFPMDAASSEFVIGGFVLNATDSTHYPRQRADYLDSPANNLRLTSANTTLQLTNTVAKVTVGGVDYAFTNIGLIKVSSNDTTLGYLNGKLLATSPLTLTENNNGSDETLTVAIGSAVTLALGGTGAALNGSEGLLYIANGGSVVGTLDATGYEGAPWAAVANAGGTDWEINLVGHHAWKTPVVAVATANLDLSGIETIDGVSIVAGDRVLAAGQSTASQNGLWVCQAGAWYRSYDADAADTLASGTIVAVKQGTVYHDTIWILATDGAISPGTTAQSWQLAAPMTKAAHIIDADGTLADITTKFNTLLSQLETAGILLTS